MSLSDALKQVVHGPVDMPEVDILSLLSRRLESRKEVPLPSPDKPYRTSRLVKMCPREEVLRFMHGVKKFETIDARLQRVFDFGTALHEYVQNNWFDQWLIGKWECVSCLTMHSGMKPSGCSCGSSKFRYQEIEMFSEDITGHTDGVLEIDGQRFLLEIKTCSSKQYEVITVMKKTPIQAHIDQVQIYMWLLGLDSALILYVEKDESLLAPFWVKKDDRVAESFLKRVQDAKSGMLNKKVPDRELCDSPTCTRAKACSTRSLCFAS